MLNEGIVRPDVRQLMKTEMIRELRELGRATPSHWQEAVFKRITGEDFSELDWDFEDNQAGAFLWTRSFDELIQELVEDGFVGEAENENSTERIMVPVDADPNINWSRFVYPSSAEN